MGAYMHGSSALKEQRQNVRMKETRKVVLHRHTIPAREKLLYLFTIMICVVVAGAIVFRYAELYEVNSRIQNIEKEITRLEMENKSLILSVRQLQEPNRLNEMGIQLGFVQPVDEAISQLSVKPQTKMTQDQEVAFKK